jgi:hypothetical protein
MLTVLGFPSVIAQRFQSSLPGKPFPAIELGMVNLVAPAYFTYRRPLLPPLLHHHQLLLSTQASTLISTHVITPPGLVLLYLPQKELSQIFLKLAVRLPLKRNIPCQVEQVCFRHFLPHSTNFLKE